MISYYLERLIITLLCFLAFCGFIYICLSAAYIQAHKCESTAGQQKELVTTIENCKVYKLYTLHANCTTSNYIYVNTC